MGVIRRALISVSDKTGVLELAKGLVALKVEILSTGGTAKLLRDNKVPVIEVGDYTGQPEILDGRLKTLHPKIHGGILGMRSQSKHLQEMKSSGIEPIDLVVVNLYPFEQTIAKAGVSLETAIENIDIGGPTMIRAAAKNWQDVTVLVDPEDYGIILGELREKGEVSHETNFRLAQKVFITMARYDGAIANYLTGGKDGLWPQALNYQGVKIQELRYGENPHQKAAYYRDSGARSDTSFVVDAQQRHGKELSFNNILDLDAALKLVKEFEGPASIIIKHNNPSGVAASLTEGAALKDIFVASRECDPMSAFGGIIAFNRPVDRETAAEITKDFYECVVAPGFSTEAFQILAAKKNIRLMEIPSWKAKLESTGRSWNFKKVSGGLLVQEEDVVSEKVRSSQVVSKRQPTDGEWQTLEFAWKVCAHVKSNAIVFARGEGSLLATIGIGCGQMSRIDATKIAISKSERASAKSDSLRFAERSERLDLGSTDGGYGGRAVSPPDQIVMASDAFFPFRDNVDEAAQAGISAIIQPGGSLKDSESLQACDEHGMAMVFTGVRHFRH